MLPSPDECTFHRQTVVSTRSQFIAPPVLAKWLQIAALLFFMCRRVLPHARTTVEMRNSRARNATSPAISSPNLASLNRLKELEKCEQLPRSATNVVNWNSATFASCAKNKVKKKLSLFGGGFTQKSRAHGNGGIKKLFLVRCELVVQFGFFFVLGKICSLFFLCHSWCLKIVSAAIRTRKKTVVQKKIGDSLVFVYTNSHFSRWWLFRFLGSTISRIKCEHVARWKRFLSAMNVRIVFAHLVVFFSLWAPPIIRLFALSWWRCFVARLFCALRRWWIFHDQCAHGAVTDRHRHVCSAYIIR